MTDFFNEQGSPDDFALPGDEAVLAQLRGDEPEQAQTPEPAAETQPEAVEETGEQPRNPDGTFAKKDEPQTDEPNLILGKFKSPDELARAYQELEQFKGRQSSELNELRQALEERLTSFEQQVQRPVTPLTPVTQDLIDSNPAAATELAYQQGNQASLAAAFEAWEEMQPARAAAWVAEKKMEALNQEWSERYSQLEQKLTPVQQQAQKNELAAGIGRLREQYPDLQEFVQTPEFADLAEKIPLAKQALEAGDPEGVVSAVETVYLVHRGRASDNLKDASREVARSAAEEAQAMREEAFVASASATTTAPARSKADEFAEGWDTKDQFFSDNWNV